MRAEHVLTHGRITNALREAGLFEGFPPDTPLPTIWRGLKYRRGLEVEERLDLAQTLMRAVKVATEGGTFKDVCEHLLPPEGAQKGAQAQQEADEMNTSLSILERFRAVEDRWDSEHGE